MKICVECKEKGHARINNNWYCGRHYSQIKRHGRIFERTRFDKNEILEKNNFAEIILYNKNQNISGKTKIDLEDVEKCREHKWFLKYSKNNKPYIQRRTGRLQLSHFVLEKEIPRGYEIDHINGNTLDNRKKNLRIVTHKQNMRNQRKLPSNNTSGHIGVTWNKINKNWVAQIKINKKNIRLGSFYNIDDAVKARRNAEEKYFGKDKTINYEN